MLAGTHVPNAPLRAAVADYRAVHGPAATSEQLAARAGLRCGTYLDRFSGRARRRAPSGAACTYGGRAMTTIRVEHAAAIADGDRAGPRELPGL